MLIKSRLLKLSSLCIMGAVAFGVTKLNTNDNSKAKNELKDEAQLSTTFKMDDVYDGDMVISDILSDEDAQNMLNASVEETKNEEFLASLPDLPGLKGFSVSRSKYLTLGIAKVDTVLDIKEKPDSSSKTVGKLVNGGGCFIKGTTNVDGTDWCQIESGRVSGYVPSSCLIKGEEAIKLMQKNGHYYAVTKEDIVVKSKPNGKGEELFQIAKGEALLITSVQGDWIEVQPEIAAKDTHGYIPTSSATIQYQLKQASKGEDLNSAYSSVGMSSKRTSIMELAKQQLGVPYVWGGTTLGRGLDCSGFVQQVFKQRAGVTLPRRACEQATRGTSVSEKDLKPGDLVFYRSGGVVTHVGIYAGEGKDGAKKIIHAPQPGDVVKYTNMNYSSNRFYRRIID